jgi:hypothetical protein
VGNLLKEVSGPFIPHHPDITIGVLDPGLVRMRVGLVWMESFQIQMDTSEVTQTSSDRARNSPANVDARFWITRTSSNKLVWRRQVNPD